MCVDAERSACSTSGAWSLAAQRREAIAATARRSLSPRAANKWITARQPARADREEELAVPGDPAIWVAPGGHCEQPEERFMTRRRRISLLLTAGAVAVGSVVIAQVANAGPAQRSSLGRVATQLSSTSGTATPIQHVVVIFAEMLPLNVLSHLKRTWTPGRVWSVSGGDPAEPQAGRGPRPAGQGVTRRPVGQGRRSDRGSRPAPMPVVAALVRGCRANL